MPRNHWDCNSTSPQEASLSERRDYCREPIPGILASLVANLQPWRGIRTRCTLGSTHNRVPVPGRTSLCTLVPPSKRSENLSCGRSTNYNLTTCTPTLSRVKCRYPRLNKRRWEGKGNENGCSMAREHEPEGRDSVGNPCIMLSYPSRHSTSSNMWLTCHVSVTQAAKPSTP
ncbi:hypothetical protein, variant 3 [Cladophialophora immunda]|uniref:Uncharacterized protein n=1 Tax=Cladophialophora immunda TaxID=569365 RepID=A0A0D2D566_9EURO|nr:hypothetical protein, variant 3 [Cladophialophora immunda]KIW30824.1 hypothetical protein, variant 3 [Cladophialophora immunda]